MGTKEILPDFQAYLLSHKLATQKNVLFLAIWVTKFLAFSNRRKQQGLKLTVAEFPNSLEAKADIQGWQARQADEAISQ